MQELIPFVFAAIPGVLYAGGLQVRISRMEKDLAACVRHDLHTAQMMPIQQSLTRLEENDKTILALLARRAAVGFEDEGSGSHRIPR